jgi:hypothetical protein
MSKDAMYAAAEETSSDFFSLPTLEVPKTPADAHRAKIDAVTARYGKEKGTPGVQITLTSLDVPTITQNMTIWLSKEFADALETGAKFDPSVLTPGQQTSYRINVANSDYNAILQELVFNAAGSVVLGNGKQRIVKDSVAVAAGRTPASLGLRPARNFDEYVENINKMLQGLEVIMKRGERGGDDPAFSHNLEPKKILSADAYETNPRAFRGLVLAWNQ